LSTFATPSFPVSCCTWTCADTLEAYLARPIGRYLAGPTYSVWWHDERLSGLLLWDRPEEEHIRTVMAALDCEIAPEVARHASLIDARRLHAIDLGAFGALSRYIETRRAALSRAIARQALIRPDGLAGAAVAGFYATIKPCFPVKVFTDPADALEWLGAATCSTSLLESLHEVASRSRVVAAALQKYLESAGGRACLSEAARALKLSPRQLQRKLHEDGTCFVREQRFAMIRRARTLLVDTNYHIKRVAIEVGYRSLPHFCAAFHKAVGETPTAWRDRSNPSTVGALTATS